MGHDLVMQALSYGTSMDSVHAGLSNDIVVRFLSQLSALCSLTHYFCLVDISPEHTAMITTGANTSTPMKQATRKMLKRIHWSIVNETQEALARPGAFRNAVSGQQAVAVDKKVPADVAQAVLEQMLHFAGRAFDCRDELGAVTVNGVYSDVEVSSVTLDADLSLFLATPQDIMGKETALAVGSDLYDNQKFCWR
jgi:hypothetical protein